MCEANVRERGEKGKGRLRSRSCGGSRRADELMFDRQHSGVAWSGNRVRCLRGGVFRVGQTWLSLKMRYLLFVAEVHYGNDQI